MYKLNVNEKWDFYFENGIQTGWDIVEWKKGHFHIIKDGKNLNVELLALDKQQKLVNLKIDGVEYSIKLKDKYDLLLEKLGMENTDANKISEIKAPMPGLVTRLIAKPGDLIEKGTQVIVLEAMKMENVLKSPGTGKIKAFKVNQGDAVEKNQILIELE